jgi:hypothetical protein
MRPGGLLSAASLQRRRRPDRAFPGPGAEGGRISRGKPGRGAVDSLWTSK